MSHQNDTDKSPINESARSALVIILFGVGILAFLVLVERPHWFHIRPVTGVANAMAISSSDAQAERTAQVAVRTSQN